MSFSFGTTPASTAKPTGFSFGTPSTIGTTPGFGAAAGGFGSTPAPVGFGATPASSAPTTAGFGFGAASSTPGGFGAGFKAAAATTTTTNSSFGGFGVAPSTQLGCAAPTTTTSTLSFGGLSKPFGAATTTTTSSIAPAVGKPFSLGLGGAKVAPNLGLGGTTNSSGVGGASESSKSDIKALKETQIPNEILSTVDEFKKLVKEERNISSDIAHISSRIHDKIKVETEALGRLVSILSSGIKKNKAALDKLKLEAAQELRNAEIAQRTKDTPGALQYENVAPYEYFSRLVSNFENDMLKYRQQIDETEQHLHASASSAALSPEDLSKAIRKIHEAFTSLAGRYQHIHDCIQEQKGLYVKLHRQIYGVSTDLFDGNRPPPRRVVPSNGLASKEGPSPFILGHRDPFTAVRANLTAQPQQSSSLNSGGPPTMGLGAAPSSFGMGNNNSQFGGGASSSMFSGGGFSNSNTTMGQTQGLLGSTISPFMNTTKDDKKICFS